MSTPEAIWSLLVATLLGLLIGLERERKRSDRVSIFAGIRTFPLIALFGAVLAQLQEHTGPAVVAVGLFALGVLLGLAYWRTSSGEKIGGTTEVAALVTFGLGVTAGFGFFATALAGAVLVVGVLSLRVELHTLAGALTREDLYAVVQFAAVSLVVLPLVPDAHYGPWGVWNPRAIWLLVVLISGVSFVGYVATQLFGAQRGLLFSGLVGGLASSTAVALAFSSRSRLPQDAQEGGRSGAAGESGTLQNILAAGVLFASEMTLVRLLVYLSVVQRELVLPLLPPFGVLFLVILLGAGLVYRKGRRQGPHIPTLENPFRLRPALTFAGIYAVVVLVARAAGEFFGEEGLYLAGALGGLTQLDAITLSVAQGLGVSLDTQTAVRALALAAASNSLFKVGIAFSRGSRRFALTLLAVLLPAAAACVAVAWWVPAFTP